MNYLYFCDFTLRLTCSPASLLVQAEEKLIGYPSLWYSACRRMPVVNVRPANTVSKFAAQLVQGAQVQPNKLVFVISKGTTALVKCLSASELCTQQRYPATLPMGK